MFIISWWLMFSLHFVYSIYMYVHMHVHYSLAEYSINRCGNFLSIHLFRCMHVFRVFTQILDVTPYQLLCTLCTCLLVKAHCYYLLCLTLSSNAEFGQGSGETWLDYVQCNGSESSLAQCSFDGWGANFCGHYSDVSVTCQPCKYARRKH